MLDIHQRDVAAGCRVLFTNTFGANRAWLAQFGRADDVEAINRAAVELARRAAGPAGFVVGDIGPTAAEEPGAAGRAGRGPDRAGVDALVLETFRLEPAIAALAELRRDAGTPPVPLIVSLWQWPDAVEDAARRLVEAGAVVVGLNCRPAIERRRSPWCGASPRPSPARILVKPGVAPGDPGCGSTPAAFAAAVPALLEQNVRLIGGCCGTTEAHVAALAAACAVRISIPNPPNRTRSRAVTTTRTSPGRSSPAATSSSRGNACATTAPASAAAISRCRSTRPTTWDDYDAIRWYLAHGRTIDLRREGRRGTCW